jgi:hypothetical protein
LAKSSFSLLPNALLPTGDSGTVRCVTYPLLLLTLGTTCEVYTLLGLADTLLRLSCTNSVVNGIAYTTTLRTTSGKSLNPKVQDTYKGYGKEAPYNKPLYGR